MEEYERADVEVVEVETAACMLNSSVATTTTPSATQATSKDDDGWVLN